MIKRKESNCIGCSNIRLIYAKGYCQSCYWSSKRKSTDKPAAKQKKPIAKFSQKKLQELKEYRIVRDKFLKENNTCQYPNCNSSKVTLHHKAGRIGSLLTDVSNFVALCWQHHQYIEEHPAEALKLGLSAKRL